MSDPAYTTVAAVKSALWPTFDPTTGHPEATALITSLITVGSRALTRYCRRIFVAYVDTKHFDAPHDPLIAVPDLQSVSALTVAGFALTVGDQYELLPINRDALTPYYNAIRRKAGLYPFPWWPKGGYPLGAPLSAISVTGTWGYDVSVPAEIGQATLEWVCRRWARALLKYETAGGVPGVAPSITLAPTLDDDLRVLVRDYRLVPGIA
jgi:hypothetical protein